MHFFMTFCAFHHCYHYRLCEGLAECLQAKCCSHLKAGKTLFVGSKSVTNRILLCFLVRFSVFFYFQLFLFDCILKFLFLGTNHLLGIDSCTFSEGFTEGVLESCEAIEGSRGVELYIGGTMSSSFTQTSRDGSA